MQIEFSHLNLTMTRRLHVRSPSFPDTDSIMDNMLSKQYIAIYALKIGQLEIIQSLISTGYVYNNYVGKRVIEKSSHGGSACEDAIAKVFKR